MNSVWAFFLYSISDLDMAFRVLCIVSVWKKLQTNHKSFILLWKLSSVLFMVSFLCFEIISVCFQHEHKCSLSQMHALFVLCKLFFADRVTITFYFMFNPVWDFFGTEKWWTWSKEWANGKRTTKSVIILLRVPSECL